MATSIALGDLIQLRIVCGLGGQYSQNVTHFVCVGKAGTGATDQDMADNLNTTLDPIMRGELSATATYEGVIVKVLKPNPAAPVVATPLVKAGTRVANNMSPQTAGLIRLRTATPGRSSRGRLYMPFPTEDRNGDDGKPLVGYLGSLDLLGNVFTADRVVGLAPNTVTIRGCIYSRKQNLTYSITSRQAQTVWATIRRRSFVNKGDANPTIL